MAYTRVRDHAFSCVDYPLRPTHQRLPPADPLSNGTTHRPGQTTICCVLFCILGILRARPLSGSTMDARNQGYSVFQSPTGTAPNFAGSMASGLDEEAYLAKTRLKCAATQIMPSLTDFTSRMDFPEAAERVLCVGLSKDISTVLLELQDFIMYQRTRAKSDSSPAMTFNVLEVLPVGLKFRTYSSARQWNLQTTIGPPTIRSRYS